VLAIFASVQCVQTNGSVQTNASEQAGAAVPAVVNGDTLRGMIQVVGSEPATWIVLQPSPEQAVTLAGQREVLEQMAGLEVVVRGRSEAGGEFRVDAVTVRAANGVPAVDGVLHREDGGYVLRTTGGERFAVPHLPEPLRERVGWRIWLAGPLDRSPDSYGLIRSP
jgi:hypothetical protein